MHPPEPLTRNALASGRHGIAFKYEAQRPYIPVFNHVICRNHWGSRPLLPHTLALDKADKHRVVAQNGVQDMVTDPDPAPTDLVLAVACAMVVVDAAGVTDLMGMAVAVVREGDCVAEETVITNRKDCCEDWRDWSECRLMREL